MLRVQRILQAAAGAQAAHQERAPSFGEDRVRLLRDPARPGGRGAARDGRVRVSRDRDGGRVLERGAEGEEERRVCAQGHVQAPFGERNVRWGCGRALAPRELGLELGLEPGFPVSGSIGLWTWAS